MKKLLIFIMITLLIVAFIGCSKESSNQKTEEELRAEIKAELEAEQNNNDEGNKSNEDTQGNDDNQATSENSNIDNNDYYELSKLKNGDKVEGLTISNISFKDEGMRFTLFGEKTVQGKIRSYDSAFMSGYTISFNEPLLNKPIVEELPSGEKDEIDFSFVEISNPEKLESLISKEQLEYIKAVPFNEVQDGNELQIEVILKDFTYTGFYQSEMYQECEIVDVLSIESKKGISKYDGFDKAGTFTGGEVLDGFGISVGGIRHGIHDDFERLVFDFYGYEVDADEKAGFPCYYTVELNKSEAIVTLDGAALLTEIPSFNSKYIEFIEVVSTNEEPENLKSVLYIVFKKAVRLKVSDGYNPGRLVIDIKE